MFRRTTRRADPAPSRPYQAKPRDWPAAAADIGRILVAALVAWQLCRWLGSPPTPLYAVLVPVLAMRTDPFASFDVSLTRIVGVLLGVTLGIGALQLLPSTIPTLALLLLVGLVLGSIRWGSLRPAAAPNGQVVVSALLVFAVSGSDPRIYAWDRLWETLVGAAVTVVVAVLLVPPDPARAARAELADLGAGMAQVLRRVTVIDAAGAADLITDAADLSARADRLADDLRHAARTGRIAPTHLRHRAVIAGLVPVGELAGTVGRQLAAMTVTVDDLAGREVYDRRWPAVRDQAGAAVGALGDAVCAALTGADSRADVERAGDLLLEFRRSQRDPVAVLLRNPMRRILDRLAQYTGLPVLDMRPVEQLAETGPDRPDGPSAGERSASAVGGPQEAVHAEEDEPHGFDDQQQPPGGR